MSDEASPSNIDERLKAYHRAQMIEQIGKMTDQYSLRSEFQVNGHDPELAKLITERFDTVFLPKIPKLKTSGEVRSILNCAPKGSQSAFEAKTVHDQLIEKECQRPLQREKRPEYLFLFLNDCQHLEWPPILHKVAEKVRDLVDAMLTDPKTASAQIDHLYGSTLYRELRHSIVLRTHVELAGLMERIFGRYLASLLDQGLWSQIEELASTGSNSDVLAEAFAQQLSEERIEKIAEAGLLDDRDNGPSSTILWRLRGRRLSGDKEKLLARVHQDAQVALVRLLHAYALRQHNPNGLGSLLEVVCEFDDHEGAVELSSKIQATLDELRLKEIETMTLEHLSELHNHADHSFKFVSDAVSQAATNRIDQLLKNQGF